MHSAKDSEMVSPKLKDFVTYGKKIFGAGLNYRSTLASKCLPTPQEPSIFMKPTTSYIVEDECILIPEGCLDVQQEVELGVIIGKKGRCIKEIDVFDHIGGYCLALDMTDGGYLDRARKHGLPWTIGKGWDSACPVSRFICKGEIPNPQDIRLYSKINCKLIQDCSTCDMVFTIPKLISYISEFITLEEFDMILTGSPAGTHSVKPGDLIEAGLGDVVRMEFKVMADCTECDTS